MAYLQPQLTLRYEPSVAGPLDDVIAPPYDVIDEELRARLAERSPYNVVHVDLPPSYPEAATTLDDWRAQGALAQEDEPAVWVLRQDYAAPDGERRTRTGVLARMRVDEYGPGRIRPHERTHPGPKEDRLRLTRATHANLSPIFSLYDDPQEAAWGALAPHLQSEPWSEVTDEDGTIHRLWRVTDPDAHTAVAKALAPAELLIADGHHRYETARVYQQEGGAGHVLMCLVALQDPGLTVFPTHRLLTRIENREALRDTIQRDFEIESVEDDALEPTGDGPVRLGYLDAHHRRPLMLTLRDPAIAAAALPDKPEPYRALDTAVLEALVLKGALGMSEDDISHLNGLEYARDTAQARERVESGAAQAAFFMGATPVQRVRDVAATGESMPPKSTYFFPKVLTGMVFNPLD